MSTLVAFLSGLTGLLADRGIVTSGGRGSGPPVHLQTIRESPSKVVALTAYPLTADNNDASVTYGLQVRVRSDGDGAEDIAFASGIDEQIFKILHGLAASDVGGVWVEWLNHNDSGPLGTDTNGRWETTSNYRARIHVPGGNQ